MASRHKLTQARVGAIVGRALAAVRDTPEGWARVELWLPPELAQQVREMEAQVRARERTKADST